MSYLKTYYAKYKLGSQVVSGLVGKLENTLMESLSSELQSGPSDQGPKCGAFTQGAVWTQMMGQPVS